MSTVRFSYKGYRIYIWTVLPPSVFNEEGDEMFEGKTVEECIQFVNLQSELDRKSEHKRRFDDIHLVREADELLPGIVVWHVYGHFGGVKGEPKRLVISREVEYNEDKNGYSFWYATDGFGTEERGCIGDVGIGGDKNNNRLMYSESEARKFIARCIELGIREGK